jgi:hypothetical protein
MYIRKLLLTIILNLSHWYKKIWNTFYLITIFSTYVQWTQWISITPCEYLNWSAAHLFSFSSLATSCIMKMELLHPGHWARSSRNMVCNKQMAHASLTANIIIIPNFLPWRCRQQNPPKHRHMSITLPNFYAVSSTIILVWPLWVRIPESLPTKVVHCVVLCTVCV